MKRKYGQTVRVNGDRLAPIKKIAAAENKTVGEVVGDAIDQYIQKRERPANDSEKILSEHPGLLEAVTKLIEAKLQKVKKT
jgi:hypothetical protein